MEVVMNKILNEIIGYDFIKLKKIWFIIIFVIV